MTAVKFEVVELVDDLFAGLACEQIGMLQHGRVDFFEGIADGHAAEAFKEPFSPAEFVGVEIPRSARRLQRGSTHASSISTVAAWLPCAGNPRGA